MIIPYLSTADLENNFVEFQRRAWNLKIKPILPVDQVKVGHIYLNTYLVKVLAWDLLL